jgi:hypothetical protein
VDVEQKSTIGKEEGKGKDEGRNSRKIGLKKRNASNARKGEQTAHAPRLLQMGGEVN